MSIELSPLQGRFPRRSRWSGPEYGGGAPGAGRSPADEENTGRIYAAWSMSAECAVVDNSAVYSDSGPSSLGDTIS